MYVCICNALTEDDVHGCMASGCTTVKQVKAACGFKPGCGMCTKRIHAMVSERRAAAELADAVIGGPPAPDTAALQTPALNTPALNTPALNTSEPDTPGEDAAQTAA